MPKFAKISEIVIKPNRQRREIDPEELMRTAESIRSNQLFHAPVLRREGESLVLVAGERRLKSCELLYTLGDTFKHDDVEVPEGYIPYVLLGEIDELAAEEAELEENVRRVDLTWQEKAAATERLRNLREKQAAAKGETYTYQDLAKEVTGKSEAGYAQQVRQESIVAKHLDNPEVAKAPTLRDAFKVLKSQEERQRNIALAEQIGSTFNASMHALVQKKAQEFLALDQFTEKFDVILTDLPYGMGADQFGDGAGRFTGTVEHRYDDSYESWQKLVRELCPIFYRVAKPQAHAYLFCDIDRFHELKSLMEAAGWYVFRTPLTVYKLNSGRVPLPEMGPRRSSEWILYAIKGKKPVNSIMPDVIPCKADEQLGHGAQKPVELYVNLLMRSVKPGDSVLDACCGSGTIFPAAHTLKVRATGCETDAASYGIAAKRLASLANGTPTLE